MNNDFVRLAILLSVLLLIVFPFAGLAPLALLLFVALCGWAFQLVSTIIGATEGATEPSEAD
ncbi:MAG: Chloroplast import component protein (Tic20) [Phormidesmis priestleyi Ana]|uniref:Chloroplast import component protein (Tic20) n=1 Tax=Phormidesmis priestleyi Ana TaxID=1666911 RepID=A0A0N8KM69_9CYAN|nr:MAG: Chloroplast import component protein (Tic20) [Phormidesmis priestleyi Ana]